jgi:phosphate starvation-inducible PhoH-like protein
MTKKRSKPVANAERLAFDKDTEKKSDGKYKVKAITEGHEILLEAVEDCQFVICSGPAGSGKTHLALGKGIEYLKENKYKKLLLIRPLQECGRGIGYLPGDKNDKISPHMKAFTELFHKFCSKEQLERFIKEEKIVVDTCEFMRGCTFDETYVVIDEAQNCTYEQLKMLLTRLGKDSKMIIVGDATQNDLPPWKLYKDRVPMDVMMDALDDKDDDIAVMELTEEDIVRNGLLAKIIKWMDGNE